jgi:hypothetical protein
VLQVCQEEYIGIAEEAALLLHDRTLTTSWDTFLPSQNPNIVIRRVSNFSQPITDWSGPFYPTKLQETAFLLWPVGESEGEEQSIQLRCNGMLTLTRAFMYKVTHAIQCTHKYFCRQALPRAG